MSSTKLCEQRLTSSVKHWEKTLEFVLKYLLPSSSQEPHQLPCLVIVPFKLVKVIQLHSEFGGIYHSRVRSFHQTLLHIRNNEDKTFISINCLKYVTIIINYWSAISVVQEDKDINDPHPVVLCVTDNISTNNWTVHTRKKSIIGRALARFFCGLLIGLDVGINAKWISTSANKIADEISRIKSLLTILPHFSMTSPNYNRIMRSWNTVVSSSQVKSCSLWSGSFYWRESRPT